MNNGDEMEVSIIIPVYNKVLYLQTILHQIQEQSFQAFQCILIDDGSTDGSGQICDKFSEQDQRFMVIHIPNSGVSHARNVGLQYATGKYITFIDADDEIHPDYLENLYCRIEQSNADMVISSSAKIWDNSSRREYIIAPYDGLIDSNSLFSEFARNQYSSGIYGYCWGKMVRHELIQGKWFDEKIRLAEDLDFYLSVYPRTKTIYFDRKPYYFYRQDAENSSMQSPDWEIDYYTQLKIQLKLFKMLKSQNSLNQENEALVINRIYDYVFFTLFHAPNHEIFVSFRKIRSLTLPRINTLKGRSWKQKCILLPYLSKFDLFAYFLIRLSRINRRI